MPARRQPHLNTKSMTEKTSLDLIWWRVSS